MDDKQQDDLIRLYDVGQPKVIRVSFTVTVEMTGQQRDGYADAHGVDFVELEVKDRFPLEVGAALRLIPWVRDFARVRVATDAPEAGRG
jgi:hypothetical protein